MVQIVFEPCYTEDMATQVLSVAPVQRKAVERGIEDPNDLWRAIGSERISRNTVKAWWYDMPMTQVDVKVWRAFADFFECGMLELVEEVKT